MKRRPTATPAQGGRSKLYIMASNLPTLDDKTPVLQVAPNLFHMEETPENVRMTEPLAVYSTGSVPEMSGLNRKSSKRSSVENSLEKSLIIRSIVPFDWNTSIKLGQSKGHNQLRNLNNQDAVVEFVTGCGDNSGCATVVR